MEIFGSLLVYIIEGSFLFLNILYWLIIIEVILSWLTLVGIQIYIQPLRNITRPLYAWTKKYIPTTIGMIDFSPIIIMIALQILMNLLANVALPAVKQFF